MGQSEPAYLGVGTYPVWPNSMDLICFSIPFVSYMTILFDAVNTR